MTFRLFSDSDESFSSAPGQTHGRLITRLASNRTAAYIAPMRKSKNGAIERIELGRHIVADPLV